MDQSPMPRSATRRYAREVRDAIAQDIFQPARSRLLWLPFHWMLIATATWGIVEFSAWPLRLVLGLVIGFSFAGLAFLAHETLHGAVVRGGTARKLVGFLGFLPFALSPRLWVAWHNREHHQHTNRVGRDPDAYPTLAEYNEEARARWMVEIGAPGLGRLRGVVTLLVGFSIQSAHMLLVASRRGSLSRKEQLLAVCESALGLLLWAGLAVAIGPVPFAFAFLLPLAVSNTLVMMHITTNHSLSPLGVDNDPLTSSLSVTVPAWFSAWTLGFGYHVEHHLFPAMSGRFGPVVSSTLRKLYPEGYQIMPLSRALLLLHRTARVYAREDRLIDPRTGRTWSTLPELAAAPTPRPSTSPPPPRSVPSVRPLGLHPS